MSAAEGDDETRLTAETVRADPRLRWGVALLGIVVGVGVATVSWIGFVLGGAVVALPQRTFPRGIVAGIGFGAIAWAAFALSLALHGSLGTYLGMGELTAVSVVIPLVGALIGSLVRGLG